MNIKIKPLLVAKQNEGIKKLFRNPEIKGSTLNELNNLSVDKFHQMAFYGDDEITWGLRFITNGQINYAVFPNPIQIYYNIAYEFHSKSSEIANTFPKQKDDEITVVNHNTFNKYIQYKSSSIILLHTALEAFINSIIPESKEYKKRIKRNGNYENTILTKAQMERLGFEEKFTKVVKDTLNYDYYNVHSKNYNIILNFCKLRNDIIHLKTINESNNNYYFELFKDIIHAKFEMFHECVKHYMNTYKPNFIEEI